MMSRRTLVFLMCVALVGVVQAQNRKPANPLAVVDSHAAHHPAPRRNPFTDSATRVLAIASGKGAPKTAIEEVKTTRGQ